MSDAGFERLCVVGLGLLGGSVAAAARRRGAVGRVVGVTRRRETAEAALARGVVDEACQDPAEGVRGADLVVLGTPLHAMPEVLAAAAAGLESGAVVTDVGSVKGGLAETLPGLLPEGVRYVGAHPMAGSHLRGLDHARDDLLEGAACVITPPPGSEAAAGRVRAFFEALGMRVVERDPAGHDVEVGWVSHVPHAVAFAYAHALRDAPAGEAEVRGSGFRDFTRIARSDPELWADILTANRKATAAALQQVADSLAELARSVEAGDAEQVERFIASGRDALARGAEDARSGGDSPEIQTRSGSHRRRDKHS